MTEKGLRDIVAAQTSISDIDGKLGRLFYAGYDIHDLAPNATFEEIVFLLHQLRLPNKTELEGIEATLSDGRDPHTFIHDLMPTMVKQTSPMSMLRTTVSAMSAYDPDGWDQSAEANFRKAMRLIASLPTVIATYERLRTGNEIVRPNPKFGHAANFLFMLTGEEPSDDDARVLDTCLVLHADHTMNASTFAARVTAATLSDIHSATVSAIATLKGPLHGGANEAVMKMVLEIGDVSLVEETIKSKLAAKEKIPGFGHPVYRTEDPRATHLRRMSQRIGEQTGNTKWFEISKRIEETVTEEKGLHPNVDFYAATVYYCLRIPVDLFTPVFAASRMAGWTAHVREQYADNRIIRPASEYIGPQGMRWKPIEER